MKAEIFKIKTVVIQDLAPQQVFEFQLQDCEQGLETSTETQVLRTAGLVRTVWQTVRLSAKHSMLV